MEQGEFGNVEAGAITVMDPDLRNRLGNGTVTNKEPTAGGKTEPPSAVSPRPTTTNAVAQLTSPARGASLERAAATPDGWRPSAYPRHRGHRATWSPWTARRRRWRTRSRRPRIEATLSGSVLTASMGDIDASPPSSSRRLLPGTEFVEGSIASTLGEPFDRRDGVRDLQGDCHGPGLRHQDPDRCALKEQVRGKTKSEAQAILDQFGKATITLSPDFMPSLPDDPNRIEI